jgi:hypothetical protein
MTYANSVARFVQIAKERGADVQLSNQPNFDEALNGDIFAGDGHSAAARAPATRGSRSSTRMGNSF